MSSSDGCPVGGGGTQAPNTSTIVAADAVEGSHVLTIQGYSRLKGLSKSGMFNIGDRTWYITYLPEGDARAGPDWISLFLTLAETTSKVVKIHVRFSLLDHAGEPVPPHIWTGDLVFTGYSSFLHREEGLGGVSLPKR
jgi:speckle-type POZ protein